jgi:hypothetical protein
MPVLLKMESPFSECFVLFIITIIEVNVTLYYYGIYLVCYLSYYDEVSRFLSLFAIVYNLMHTRFIYWTNIFGILFFF